MKKTLVFHIGRAPRGKRTNWVMHEYRLEEGEEEAPPPLPAPISAAPVSVAAAPSNTLTLALPQGDFVVCRVFQKSGSGPQNGAQYGAPFVEEEWEDADNLQGSNTQEDTFMYAPPAHQDFLQSDDLEVKQALEYERESTNVIVAKSEGQDDGIHVDNSTFLLEEILDLDGCINVPGQPDGPCINPKGNTVMGEQSHSPRDQNDGYLELKDIFDDANDTSSDGLLRIQNDHIIANGANEDNILLEVDGMEFSLDFNEIVDTQELSQMHPPNEGLFNVRPEDFLNPEADDYPSAQLTEDGLVFYDASSHNPPATGDGFVDMNGIQLSPAADLSAFDMVDDFMAYFDATDNDIQYDIFDYSENSDLANSAMVSQSDRVLEVANSSYPTCKPTLVAPGTCMEEGASSGKFSGVGKQSASRNEGNTDIPDMQVHDGWNTALRKRAMNMLGSIPAPPALAESSIKGKAVTLLSAARSSSSIHVSAGLIGITVVGSTEQWTVRKDGDMSFLFSYGGASDDVVGKSLCCEPVAKIQRGALTVMLRGGFYLFGLSVLILSAGFKLGMCVFSK